MKIIKVLVVEDHLPLQHILGMWLESLPNVSQVICSDSITKALSDFDAHLPDLVMVASHLEQNRQFQLTDHIRSQSNTTSIVMLTMSVEDILIYQKDKYDSCICKFDVYSKLPQFLADRFGPAPAI